MTEETKSAEQPERLEGIAATHWMLGLCASQIKDALGEGDASMGMLIGSVTELIDAVQYIDDHAEIHFEITGLPEDSPLHKFSGRIVDYVQNVVMALQFYDRLSQRLVHVAQGLDELAEMAETPGQLDQLAAWRGLLDRVCALHSTKEEQELFDRQVVQAPLSYVHQSETVYQAEDEIEFF